MKIVYNAAEVARDINAFHAALRHTRKFSRALKIIYRRRNVLAIRSNFFPDRSREGCASLCKLAVDAITRISIYMYIMTSVMYRRIVNTTVAEYGRSRPIVHDRDQSW